MSRAVVLYVPAYPYHPDDRPPPLPSAPRRRAPEMQRQIEEAMTVAWRDIEHEEAKTYRRAMLPAVPAALAWYAGLLGSFWAVGYGLLMWLNSITGG